MALWPGFETSPSFIGPGALYSAAKYLAQYFDLMFDDTVVPGATDGTWSYLWGTSAHSGVQRIGASIIYYSFAQPVGFSANYSIGNFPQRAFPLDRSIWSSSKVGSAKANLYVYSPVYQILTCTAQVQGDHTTAPAPGTILDPSTGEPFPWWLGYSLALDDDEWYCVWNRIETITGGTIRFALASLYIDEAGTGLEWSIVRGTESSAATLPDTDGRLMAIDATEIVKKYLDLSSQKSAFAMFAFPGNISFSIEYDPATGARTALDLIDMCSTNGFSFQELPVLGGVPGRFAVGTSVAHSIEYLGVSLGGIAVRYGGALNKSPYLAAPTAIPPRMDWII